MLSAFLVFFVGKILLISKMKELKKSLENLYDDVKVTRLKGLGWKLT